MNKHEFIDAISTKLNCDKGRATIINSIVEDTFLVGNKNKDIMIDRFMKELDVSYEEADNIYNNVMDIIVSEIGIGFKEKALLVINVLVLIIFSYLTYSNFSKNEKITAIVCIVVCLLNAYNIFKILKKKRRQ